MARAALDWSQHDLAIASGVSWRTISRFEAGEAILAKRVEVLRRAFETRGVKFVTGGSLEGAVVPPMDSI